MWFDSWSDLLRVVLVGAAAYLTLVLVLRTSGKRTLAKLNAFDLVVTVALGSVLAAIVLNNDISWIEGAVALVLLAVLQFGVAWLSVHLPGARSVLTSRPTLLLLAGQLREEALRQQRLSVDEIRQAVRSTGSGGLDTVAAVVLESDGTLSVIPRDKLGNASALVGVSGFESPER